MSSVTDSAQLEAELQELADRRSIWEKSLTLTRKNPLGAVGGLVVVVMVVAAVFAEQVTFYDSEMNDFEHMLTPPNWDYLMGTDQMGRDIFTRIIFGARTALFVGITSSVLGASFGLVLGVGSAYFGGTVDLLFQRVMDVFMAFPLIIMALAIVAIFGTGAEKVIVAITIPFIPRCARVVRSNALAIREIPYVDAARAMGFGHMRIIMRHMVPRNTRRVRLGYLFSRAWRSRSLSSGSISSGMPYATRSIRNSERSRSEDRISNPPPRPKGRGGFF